MKYPTYVKNCIELLEQSGYSAYAVGGAVRDSLLGIQPSDWDVTTNAKPDEILSVFADFRTILTGIKHGTVTVLFENEENNGQKSPIEITTFRIDGEYNDSRHPESVEFSGNLCDDLSRRDFTVNAMAFNEKDGIIDVFGGQQDIKERIIRAVGKPQKRFSEDALRILRALRFAAQLDFEIEDNTLIAAKECGYLLKNISRERIGIEFKKLISSANPEYPLKKMIECGIWQHVFGFPIPKASTVTKITQLTSGNFATRLSALIADYGDTEKDKFLSSLRLSNAEKKLVLRLSKVKSFDFFENETNLDAIARHFLHLYNNIYDEAKEMLEFFFEDSAERFIKVLDIEQKKNNPLSVSDLEVKGSDLFPLCKNNFSNVGKTLDFLLQCVIENPKLNEKEKLMTIAKKELE